MPKKLSKWRVVYKVEYICSCMVAAATASDAQEVINQEPHAKLIKIKNKVVRVSHMGVYKEDGRSV